ncbi:MAG: hypothetical protein KDB00_27190 [Planctomycetales bacterium]|nr:hypothetical protein [Planctomycetales bacterium]
MSAPTAVSAATAPATMSSTVGSDKMTVGCGCGAKLKVATSARGKQVQCPKCGQRLTVTGDPIIIGGTSNSMSGVLIGAGMAVFGALGAAWVVYSNFLSSAHEA